MEIALLLFSILTFVLTYWLGLYLLRRDAADPRLLWTGVGLILYALVVGVLLVQVSRSPDVQSPWPPQFWWLLSLPAVAWTGAAVHLLPQTPIRPHMQRFWLYGQAPLVLLLAPFFVIVGATGDAATAQWLLLALAILVLLPLLIVVAVIAFYQWRSEPRPAWVLLLVAALFFALSLGALLLPIFPLDPAWLLLGMGGDLLVLGLAICAMDAFDQGEKLLPDLLLSLDGALLYALIFGGLVVVAMIVETGITPAMLALLLLSLAAAIGVQLFASPIQAGLDRLALASLPAVREERSELREEVEELSRQIPRTGEQADDPMADDVAFARLTRRALSQMNDLNKLSGSPLTELSVVEMRLAASGVEAGTTARAQALQALLAQAIDAMKPPGDADFGTTGQWRFYNALYYPYVVGLRPYRRRADSAGLDEASQQALAWFREQVPERTLYNWQKRGAEWVARYLRDLEIQGNA